jgi:threonine aldolase
MPIVINSVDGVPEPDAVETYLQRDSAKFPRIGLICLENTHNRRGGRAVALDKMQAIHQVSQKYNIPVHLDGARIFNAAHALAVEATEIASHVDSVMFCLSKGLCAPVGSMLAGNDDFIQKARLARKRLGGGMRQSGMLAAAGIVSLMEMTHRLVEDHANAKLLAKALSQFDELDLCPESIDTNMVFVKTEPVGISATEFADRALQHNIRVSVYGPTTVRFVANHDVSREDVLCTADTLVDLVGNLLKDSE